MSEDHTPAAADEELFDGFDDDEAQTQEDDVERQDGDEAPADAGSGIDTHGERDAGQADERPGEREGRPQETSDGHDGQRVSRPGRRERAAAALREARDRAEAADRRAAAVEQQLQQLLGRQSQEQRAAEEAAFQQQLQMLPPDQVGPAVYQRIQQQNSQHLGALRQQLADDNDRAQFEQLLTQEPRYRQFTAEVERFRREGAGNVPRRLLLATAIGLAAMERAPAARNRAASRAAAAGAAVTTRPAASGQGQPADRRRNSTPAERLANIPL